MEDMGLVVMVVLVPVLVLGLVVTEDTVDTVDLVAGFKPFRIENEKLYK
jgi:hypothetical protein